MAKPAKQVVSALLKPEMKVEIEADARLQRGGGAG